MNYPSNLLSELKPIFRSQLEEIYERKEADNLVNLLIKHYLGMTRTAQVLNAGFRLSESELLNLHFAMKRLRKSEPIQYILGEVDFGGLKISVNPDVLIPRPETEEIVEQITQQNIENKKILDIGTGSGCIALALKKKLPHCQVTGLDISEKALEIAGKNAATNNLKVKFIQADISDANRLKAMGVYDIIVSNPPYVTEEDKALMNQNVLGWEPAKALFVPQNDPLFFYRKILEFSEEHLIDGGEIYLEINETYGQGLKTLMEAHSFSQISLHQDFRGKDRFVFAVK